MATSDGLPARLARYAGSRGNLAGCAGGLVGVGIALTGAAGPLWPLVVAGLYGAGALIAAPERHLERQPAALREEAGRSAAALRDPEALRQEIHTRYVEERGG